MARGSLDREVDKTVLSRSYSADRLGKSWIVASGACQERIMRTTS